MAPLRGKAYGETLRREGGTGAFWRDVMAELLGTFLLVFAQLLLLQNWQQADKTNPQAIALQNGLGMACVVSAVGYALGDFGGANLNPAVTLALMVRAEITFLRGVMYWIAQLGGAIVASFFVLAVTPMAQVTSSRLGNTYLGPDVTWWQGLLIEMTLTLTLTITALAAGNVRRKGTIVIPSVPVGLALGLGLLLGFHSTGGSLNPARSLGPCVVLTTLGNQDCWTHHYVYWAGPMLGAVLAAVFYWIFDAVKDPKPEPLVVDKPEYFSLPTSGSGSPPGGPPLLYMHPGAEPGNVTTIAIPPETRGPVYNRAYYPY